MLKNQQYSLNWRGCFQPRLFLFILRSKPSSLYKTIDKANKYIAKAIYSSINLEARWTYLVQKKYAFNKMYKGKRMPTLRYIVVYC